MTALLYSYAFIFGIIFGSFLNVCISRLPSGASIIKPRSRCPSCKKSIAAYDNIPLLSFLILRGRCRNCKKKISWEYPAVEFVSGLLAMACLAQLHSPGLAALWFLTFICPLLVVSVIDLHHYIIPDEISLPFIGVGFLTRLISVQFQNVLPTLLDSLAGALLGGGVLFLFAVLYEKIRKQEGLGGGDVKLLAMIGAFLGWKAVFLVIFFSSVLASLVGIFLMIFKRAGLSSQIPYGPFLALGAILQFFWGKKILLGYFNLIAPIVHFFKK